MRAGEKKSDLHQTGQDSKEPPGFESQTRTEQRVANVKLGRGGRAAFRSSI